MKTLTRRVAKIEEAESDRFIVVIASEDSDSEALHAEIAHARKIDPRRIAVLPADTALL